MYSQPGLLGGKMCNIGRGSETIRARFFWGVWRDAKKVAYWSPMSLRMGGVLTPTVLRPPARGWREERTPTPGYPVQRLDPRRNSDGVHDLNDSLPGVAVNGNPGLED